MFWFYIGIGLLLWVAYDLYRGRVWSYRAISRAAEPGQYWLWMSVWLMVALLVLAPYVVGSFGQSPYQYAEERASPFIATTTERITPAVTTTTVASTTEITSQEETDDCQLLEDFDGTSGLRWGTVNDGVMGGLSDGVATLADGVLVHSGTINTNGGGFSYVGTRLPADTLTGYDSIKLRLNTYGRAYDVNFNDSRYWRVNHQVSVPGGVAEDWREVTIAFGDTVPTVFSRQVTSDPFVASAIDELNFILADGIDGPFRMELDWVKLCRE